MRSMVAEMASNDAVPSVRCLLRTSGITVRANTLVWDANDISVCAIWHAPAGQSPSLKARGSVAAQIAGLPDGAQVRFVIDEGAGVA